MRRLLAPVRVRVTVAAALVALIGGVAGALVFVSELRSGIERDLLSSGAQQADAMVAQLADGASPDDVVASGKNDIVLQVVRDGHIVATDHPRLTRPLLSHAGSARHVRIRGLEDEYAVTARARGRDLVVVGRSSEEVGRATAESATLLGVAVPLGVVLLATVVWLSLGRALRPVESMRRTATEITSSHLDQRLDVPPGGDELARLAATLNEMLDRIDESHRLQRQFVSDASHELLSPLAAIRQLAEVARDYPGRTPAADLVHDVLLEEHRMEGLVTALLVLARLDDGQQGTAELVDLDDLVLEEVRRMRAATGPEAPTIDLGRVGAGQVRGNRVLLAQAVRNLLANALRHASSRVQIALVEQDDRVILTVDDDGSGVPADERARVFERFVRLDDARDREAGGSGLGLAIVRKVVESTHGTVAVGDSPTGGARFEVSLPVAQA